MKLTTFLVAVAASTVSANVWTDCSVNPALCTGSLCCGEATYVGTLGFGNVKTKTAAKRTVCGVSTDVTITEALAGAISDDTSTYYVNPTALGAVVEWNFKCNSTGAK